MRRLITVTGLIILSVAAVAQSFEPDMALPDSIKHADLEWTDFDNDGLLDVLLLMKSESGKSYLTIIKGDSIQPLSQTSKVISIPSHHAYLVADYNRDNAMDLIVSGEVDGARVTVVYINKGSYDFDERELAVPPFTTARFADLDDDATPEFVLTGEDDNGFFTKILKQTSNDTWIAVHDSLKIKCSSIETIDADGDGDVDLFLSGGVQPDSLFSGYLINKKKFYFERGEAIGLAGNTAVGDFNQDGFFEIVLMGQNKRGDWLTKIFEKTGNGYRVNDGSVTVKNGKPFIADFDYDGYADINYYGIGAGDTINFIQFHDGNLLPLPKDRVILNRFGDLKHDGNLDLLNLHGGEKLHLVLSSALPQRKNLAPGSPQNAIALPVFNRVLMYWEKPADDHTAKQSLTYDVYLEGVKNYRAGEFDLFNQKRLTVSHGNNGSENFKLLKHIEYEGLKFSLQAVDNSFHAGDGCIGGPGAGTAPGCATVTTESVSACSYEKLVLTSPPNALWFSFAHGFLGIRDHFDFSADKGDTLFYYSPKEEGCSSLNAWTIQIKNDTLKIEKTEEFVCADLPLQLNAEPGWDNIRWESQKQGTIGSSESIVFRTREPDSLVLTLSNLKGCTIIRKTAINISKPALQVSADHFKITKGGDVQLLATGAQRYIWTPATGLNEVEIPNPISTPVSTIRYTVTGFDSLNCSATAEVTIEVEETGFIPTLFSPNDDGQNDQLKIYGVAAAQRFSLSIYDREGALVYRTSNVSEAVQHGWDGTKNGTKQPPGVYFWKVKGELASGPLLLNGKDSGSFVLIR